MQQYLKQTGLEPKVSNEAMAESGLGQLRGTAFEGRVFFTLQKKKKKKGIDIHTLCGIWYIRPKPPNKDKEKKRPGLR